MFSGPQLITYRNITCTMYFSIRHSQRFRRFRRDWNRCK